MKNGYSLICIMSVAALLTGCSTVGRFKTPEGTSLYIDRNPIPVTLSRDGKVTRRPFFWTAAGGIRYKLEKDGAVVQTGKLPSRFRVISIFWPPYALIYWPFGFVNYTYDLTSAEFSNKTQ